MSFDDRSEYVDEGTGEVKQDAFPIYPGYQTDGRPIFVPDTTDAAGALAKRVCAAILAIEGRIEKSAYNPHFKFHYASSEDIKAAARKALAEQEVFLLPAMKGLPDIIRQGNQWKHTVEYWFTLIFPEGKAYVPWVAESLDTSDKGLPKSLTTSVKYFLISLLLIPTGDDPDTDAGGETKSEGEEPKKPQRQSGQSGRRSGQSGRRQQKSGKPAAKQDDGAAKKSWPAETVQAIIKRKFVADMTPPHAINLLNLSHFINPGTPADICVDWAACYKAHKDAGKERDEAVELADAAIKNQMDANENVEKWIAEHAGVIPEEKEEAEQEEEVAEAD